MDNQVFESTAEQTFQYQSTLPPLPVPSLEGTLSKYLESVRPFTTEEEFKNTAAIVKQFGDGVGHDLHQRLLQRAKSRRNWLEDWWLSAAYLEVRMPSQLNVNFGGPAPYLEHCWPPCEGKQLERTSISVWHNLQYWDLIRTCPCRQLTHIRQCCDGEPSGEGVSALTTEERTRWAKTREHLVSLDPANESILEIIQSSLFVVSLDDSKPYATPENYSPITLQALVGDPTIRWGDKSYNYLSFADGTFGSNCDHAPYDAMILISLCYYVDQKLKACNGKWKGSEVVRQLPLPEELVFTVDDRIRRDISLAKDQYYKTTQDLQVVTYAFTSFGKAAIKKRKLHPDTFVQLALQLAYYRLHHKVGSCYETATTRRFYHGRTETMRPCTTEAQSWCRIMLDPTASAETKRTALQKAANKHNKLMNEAQNGKGIDRHLLGLSLIAKEEGLPVPELFTDPVFAKSGGGGNFTLSTSLVGYTTVLGAVAPMVHHGYGFFYRIRDDRLVASCSAWKSCAETNAEAFFHSFSTSLHEMLALTTLSQL
ncbi:peroxisomal carnitine O-octanoyltransferase [Alosa alosa]|uniref:peroxisomal carnitine O-octanoyltransferase n=1 Tax=Alosa alosa TaxID=278164 RepID=UPI0020153F37|nr:peroxisomal carnitine O-octanoyltransferase [Alosa alosa]